MLTATKAGAVPIAVLLHSSQTTEGYSLAFQLLKDSCPSCFGNRQAPLVLMSDNSRPDKDALKKTWPAAKQLLCQFHVLQAEWHWLTAAGNKDPKEDQRQLMAAFQKDQEGHCAHVYARGTRQQKKSHSRPVAADEGLYAYNEGAIKQRPKEGDTRQPR
nr:uncharacterized protein LOC129384083 isoform X1 [Dermacentor andersoni]